METRSRSRSEARGARLQASWEGYQRRGVYAHAFKASQVSQMMVTSNPEGVHARRCTIHAAAPQACTRPLQATLNRFGWAVQPPPARGLWRLTAPLRRMRTMFMAYTVSSAQTRANLRPGALSGYTRPATLASLKVTPRARRTNSASAPHSAPPISKAAKDHPRGTPAARRRATRCPRARTQARGRHPLSALQPLRAANRAPCAPRCASSSARYGRHATRTTLVSPPLGGHAGGALRAAARRLHPDEPKAAARAHPRL